MSDKKDNLVTIRTRYEKGTLYFEVEDTGSGMEYDIKQKIFTTFFTTKGGMGTGLGLLTTRKIIQEHGGKISVVSKKGEGSKFIMSFPVKRLNLLYNSKAE
jgi:signal transduction histidine kinase